MARRKYRSVSVKDVRLETFDEGCADGLVVGIDIAKEKQFAAFMSRDLQVQVTVHWQHPTETRAFVELLLEVRSRTSVEVVMEPSGVYGDSIRYVLHESDFEVCRVSPKRTHDAAEVYDGVPSLHDAKAAAIIAKLHLDGASSPWPFRSEEERDLVAALRVVEIHHKQARQGRNRIEGFTARHWPELTYILEPKTATLLELLSTFGSPQAVAAQPEKARELMKRVGGSKLAREKIDAIVESAGSTIGVPPTPGETMAMSSIAIETRRHQLAIRASMKEVEKLSANIESMKTLVPVLGVKTAATIIAGAGDPREYGSAKALVKAVGLNLRTHSSGKCKPGKLHITKRGSGMTRMMLFMAALRLIKSDRIAGAWYEAKVKRSGGRKMPGIVAIMRKLVSALWYVARGHEFDSRKLFDAQRLDLGSVPAMP